MDIKHLRYMSEKFREISEAQMFQVLSKEKPEVRFYFFIFLKISNRSKKRIFRIATDERGRTQDVREIVEEN